MIILFKKVWLEICHNKLKNFEVLLMILWVVFGKNCSIIIE